MNYFADLLNQFKINHIIATDPVKLLDEQEESKGLTGCDMKLINGDTKLEIEPSQNTSNSLDGLSK